MEKNYLEGPLYSQIYKIIVKRIDKGIYNTGSLLPSESELQKEFNVSRTTVRKALDDLQYDGYILKKQGIGAIVLENNIYDDTFQLTSFSENIKNMGGTPKSIILEHKHIKASVDIAEHLNIKPGENVLFLKRLRLVDGKITALHKTYISLNLGLNFNDLLFDENMSLYKYYVSKGIKLNKAIETLKVSMPDEKQQQELFISSNEPIVKRYRTTFDDLNRPIEYSKNYNIGNKFRYKFVLERQ